MFKSPFAKAVLSLLIPMALQNLINVGIVSTDVIMLSRVDEFYFAAVYLAKQKKIILTLIYFCIASGATVLTAQYWGKKDIKSIEKITGIAIRASFCLSLLFFCFAFFFSDFAMRIFTNDELIISQGIKYLKIVSFSYLITSVSVVYLIVLRTVEKVAISTVIYLFSLIINIIINYLLIFGNFGFPKMGVEGAAIGTLIARIFELTVALIYNKKVKNADLIKKKYLFSSDPFLRKDFFKYSMPVMFNEMLWSMGMAASAAILGRLGSSVVAANSITGVVRQLSMIICFGIANTTAIMVGKEIGAHNPHLALKYSSKFLKLSFLFGIFGSILIFLISPFIVKNFAINEEVANYLSFMLKILLYYVIFQGVSVTLIVGVFRAGGDTKYALMLDTVSLWGWSIIVSSIAAFYFKMPPKFVYFLIMSDEVVKLPATLLRYKSKKWLNNVTRDFHS